MPILHRTKYTKLVFFIHFIYYSYTEKSTEIMSIGYELKIKNFGPIADEFSNPANDETEIKSFP